MPSADTSLSDCCLLYKYLWVAGVLESLLFEPYTKCFTISSFNAARLQRSHTIFSSTFSIQYSQDSIHCGKIQCTTWVHSWPDKYWPLVEIIKNNKKKMFSSQINLLWSYKSVAKAELAWCYTILDPCWRFWSSCNKKISYQAFYLSLFFSVC